MTTEKWLITKEELASWFQDKFWDKTLSFWCRVLNIRHNIPYTIAYADKGTVIYVPKNSVWGYYSFDNIEHYDNWLFEIIGHPLRYWQLYQERSSWMMTVTSWDERQIIKYTLQDYLVNMWLMNKTIYERVENELVMNLLIELKDLIESE